MCGRFTLTKSPDMITRHFALDAATPGRMQPRYNIAPTQNIHTVRRSAGRRELVEARWGLIPTWSRGPAAGSLVINARAETIAQKPAFRDSFRTRRCLVPADGFYEWQATGKRKQPWYIAFSDDSLLAFAGLWEEWRAPDGAPIESCAIVTTTPNERLAPIHDRMPVIIPPAAYDTWLGGREYEALDLLRPYPAEAFRAYPVSSLVSRPESDVPACRDPLPEVPDRQSATLFHC